MSNFLAGTFDTVRKSALEAARRALPQRCELCASASGARIICKDCWRALPWLGRACSICALPTAAGELCGQCLAHPPAFDATIAAFAYAFPVDRLIHAFKYQGRLSLADWCADAILAAGIQAQSCLIALPLSEQRQRERGWNQAAEIARAIADKTRIALLKAGVRRVRATPPQAALPWPERARNVRGAFACDVALDGATVAVIDDVMTTGATLAEFARTLKAAGAARVENWVVARTLP